MAKAFCQSLGPSLCRGSTVLTEDTVCMSPTGEGTDISMSTTSSNQTTRLKEKKLEISSGFPQYLRQNFQCKFAPQPIGSALLALPLTVRQ